VQFFASTEIYLMKWCAPIVRKWRAPVIVTTIAIAIAFILLLTSPSLGNIANLFLVIPIASLFLIGLLIIQKGKTRATCFALLSFYALTSWQMEKHWMETRSELRWIGEARSWKDETLQRPSEPGSGIKWVVWDGWGMFAQDTDVYLVFDPDDGLRNYSPSHLNGLPKPVWKVQRLEKQWYSVTFFTEDGWWADDGTQR
jgi:hypothetical protein